MSQRVGGITRIHGFVKGRAVHAVSQDGTVNEASQAVLEHRALQDPAASGAPQDQPDPRVPPAQQATEA